VRTADQNELPPALKRLRRILRPTGLAKHQAELLGALDLAPTRALILQWLDDAKPPLSKPDAAVLRTAARAGDGWRDSFPAGPHAEPDNAPSNAALERLEEQLEREKARATKAREAERAAKEALTKATKEAGLAEAALSRENVGLREQRAQLQEEVDAHRAMVAKLNDERARERRRAERDLEKERRARQDAERTLKLTRRDLHDLEAELARRNGGSGKTPRKRKEPVSENTAGARSGPGKRKRLPAPQGLLDEDPKSLERWLQTDHVGLLIDGYNVSKSGTGFAHLSLEDQRKRVIDVATRLARKNDLTPIVVFDGGETPPGRSRPVRGPVLVEYSTGEIADDHLIARLEGMPSETPVVFVTDDRELQRRAAALGATIATSGQLLALAR
jgi:predicted RNA-binding protein with PIN domain